MQSFFVFGAGGIKAKFKSKLSLRWCLVLSLIQAYFLKWGQCHKLSISPFIYTLICICLFFSNTFPLNLYLCSHKSSSTQDFDSLALLGAKVERVGGSVLNLVEDVTRLVRANEGLREEGARAREAARQCETICADLQRVLAMTQVNLLGLEERLLQLRDTEYDGEWEWVCEGKEQVGNVKLLSISIDNIYCQFEIDKI